MPEPINRENLRTSKLGGWFPPALGYPQFRLLWISGLFTWVGRWIEITVTAWLVLELTNSAFWVGMLGTIRYTSNFIGPFCGAICDRVNQRWVLLTVQIVYWAAAMAVLALFVSTQIKVWHLFAFNFIGGLSYSFDFAARYSVAAGIVRNHDITSSISLMQALSGITSVVGPLVGGNLLEGLGAVVCFASIATAFLLSFWFLFPLKVAAKPAVNKGPSIWQEAIAGLRYVRENRLLFALILIAAMANLAIFPYLHVLVPIFARNILKTGADGFGMLLAGLGMGAIIGSLSAGALPRFANHGKILVGALIVWPSILSLLSLTRSFEIAMVLHVIAGIAQGISLSLLQAQLMIQSKPEMRGRVSGARSFAICTLSPGSFLAGYAATLWGVPTAIIISCLVFLLITVLIVVWAPELIKRR